MPPRELSQPILLGTSNAGKLAEISGFARTLGFEVFGLKDPSLAGLGEPPHVAEVAGTYEGNSRLKAVEYARWCGRACVADDTGLELEVLGGLPGVHTAPWGPRRIEEELGVNTVVPARFVCCMSYAEPSGRVVSTMGIVEGELRNFDAEKATGPLPFSKFFYPQGGAESMERLLAAGYNASHRFLALKSLADVLS